jgi:hypothetical protein
MKGDWLVVGELAAWAVMGQVVQGELAAQVGQDYATPNMALTAQTLLIV